MTWIARPTPRDDAADAARFLTRLAYTVFAIGAPVGLLLHPLAIYLLSPIGVGLLIFAAALDPGAVDQRRLQRVARSPIAMLALALLGWAALSILWTPFRVEAWQQTLRYLGFGVGLAAALGLTRPHARATNIYLMSAGVVLSMSMVFASWIALKHGARYDYDRIGAGGLLIATLAYPAMAGLVARGRDGYARFLLVLTLVFLYALNATGIMVAFLAGFIVLSFAFTGPRRAAREMAVIAAGAIAFAPVAVMIAQPLLRLILNAKLHTLEAPYPSIAYAFQLVTRDGARLVTGHGFETMTHGMWVGALPKETPTVALFQIWYELGFVGAWVVAAIVFFAYRAIGELPGRIAPFLCAALTTVLTLGTTTTSLDDWTWLMMLGLALISADLAARSHYLTRRPSADHIADV